MDAVLLSRIQFGLTAFFHFLFPPLTIGLAALIAVIEFFYWRRGDALYDKTARFWSKLFMINFAVGVATGITMEFQFGTNWSEYAKFVGDIFGAPLAAEGVFAFFLESTFVGLLFFGRDKISRGMRFFSALMVAVGSALSAFWIIAANSWQQTPAGYTVTGGRAVLTDFFGAVFNPSTLPRYFHTVDGALMTGAVFMIGVSAYFLLKHKNMDVAKTSIKIALVFALVTAPLQVFLGDIHATQVAETQPAKLAAFEGLWQTQSHAPLLIFGLPDQAAEKNSMEISLPGMLSWLATGNVNAPVEGLKAFPPAERPPILPTFASFHLMVLIGVYLVLLILWGLYLVGKGKLHSNKLILKLFMYAIPLPFLANELGWIAAEMGRQPWIVYGVLKTANAASPLPAGQVLATTLAFTLVYSCLFAAVIYLMRREIKRAMGEDRAAKETLKTGGAQLWT